MRPILLDMHGFASFREPTRVDFRDADFFALIGPTGSGKSTVIDAMTFALYGSVPRWGNKARVSLALAPTVARGTVKLVFEVDGQRYVVAREVRRTAAQVSQRAASLERLLEADGLAEPGDQTFPMARDIDGVTEAVERLLGLKYEYFTQCVVLPQGKFADFLHATSGQRQDILLSLLGAEHYRQMMKLSNERAGAARQRADTLAETLLGYADATPEAEEQAAARESALNGLGDQVGEVLPLIARAQQELSDLEAQVRRLRGDHAALSGLRVPDGIGTLSASLASGRTALDSLRSAERTAETADGAARDALAAAPARAPLELARERRKERGERQAQLPGLETRDAELSANAEEAAVAAGAAEAAREKVREQRDQASQDASAAAAEVARMAAQHAKLTSVSVPGGVGALQESAALTAGAVIAAARGLDAAETAEHAARAALSAAVADAPLAQAARDLGELRDAMAGMPAARRAVREAAVAQSSADEEVTRAAAERVRLQAAHDSAQRANVVAGLRPHLVAGAACPVCEQTVVTVPPALPSAEIDEARARVAEGESALSRAQDSARKAASAVASAESGLKSVAERADRAVTVLTGLLDGPLADAPLPVARTIPASWHVAVKATGSVVAADIDAAVITRAAAEIGAGRQERADQEQAAVSAAGVADTARKSHKKAMADAETAARELSGAGSVLRAARDPLVELGAPQVDETNLAAAWAQLAGWAAEQALACSVALTKERAQASELAELHRSAVTQFSAADLELSRLRDAEKQAVTGQQRAQAQLAQVRDRISELDGLLGDAPDEAEITEKLALAGQLQAAAQQTGQRLRTARDDRVQAEEALGRLEKQERSARDALSAARDAVVGYGAPVLSAGSLLDAWTDLVTWAAGQAQERVTEIAAASNSASQARSRVAELSGKLSIDLAGAGISVAAESVATQAQQALARSLAQAQAATQRVKERRAEAVDLAGRQQAAADEHRVAKMLGGLLDGKHFQNWLVSEAVDELVAAASGTLSDLSSGQFDLTQEQGDFYVIDHADADSRRSVRTLSGGETFQASLALALALSSQIAALAAVGAARLDSIFLDEGFGTLDPETLEVVATTLETLAQGDRMVGVVSHVPALAERVPVRFKVARNARTSTITREGFSITEEAMS
jgi:exonuclease SbcC